MNLILTSWLFVFSLGLLAPIEHTMNALLYSVPVLVLPIMAHDHVQHCVERIGDGKTRRALYGINGYTTDEHEADTMTLSAWVIARAISNLIAAAAPFVVLAMLWSTT